MKKNITSILQRGNIKPSDRVKLLVADMASKERDGKALLTEADKHALSEGWTPKNNEEVREYNRFNEGWKNVAYAEMDALTTYLQATNSFLRASKYISYTIQKNRHDLKDKTIKSSIADKAIEGILKKEDETKALNLVLGYLGLELDYTIYLYAFELAGEQLQKDLLALYPDAKTERDYLEQEEIIYNLFKSKDKLSQTDKEKLAELIVDKCFTKYAREWRFDSYFADLPLFELLGKWAFYYKEMPKKPEDLLKHLEKEKYADEGEEVADLFNSIKKALTLRLTAYAEKHNTTIRELLKDTIIKWLDDGLFIKDFTPLYLSEDKATINEQDTKLTHKELFKKWLDVKTKATETIQGLIDNGELKTAKRTREFKNLFKLINKELDKDRADRTLQENIRKHPLYNIKNLDINAVIVEETGQDETITETKTIITGESLYNLKGDFNFVKDLREQAEDFKLLGALVLFLRECRFVKDYSTLLAFELLFKELSKTFETDLTYSVKKWIISFREDLELLKLEFLMLGDDIMQANYKGDRVYYLSESYIEELLTMPFDPDKIKPDMDGKIKVYAGKIKDILQDDFKNPFDYEK
jgi:hypothetical protein